MKTTFVILFLMFLAFNVGLSQNFINKKKVVKDHIHIEYERDDGSVYETYLGSNRWHEVKPSKERYFKEVACQKQDYPFTKLMFIMDNGEIYTSYGGGLWKLEGNEKYQTNQIEPEQKPTKITGLFPSKPTIINIAPIPATDNIKVNVYIPEETKIELNLLTPYNKPIPIFKGKLDYGVHYFDVSRDNLPQGVYSVALKSMNGIDQKKLLITK